MRVRLPLLLALCAAALPLLLVGVSAQSLAPTPSQSPSPLLLPSPPALLLSPPPPWLPLECRTPFALPPLVPAVSADDAEAAAEPRAPAPTNASDAFAHAVLLTHASTLLAQFVRAYGINETQTPAQLGMLRFQVACAPGYHHPPTTAAAAAGAEPQASTALPEFVCAVSDDGTAQWHRVDLPTANATEHTLRCEG
jgi:hypothetical protein